MFGTPFYNQSIRKVVIAFGTLFNNVNIQRYNADGTVKESIRVPLSYGPKEKYLRRLREGGSISDDSLIQMTLPRMAFEITNLEYDPQRKRNTLGKKYTIDATDDSKLKWNFNEVPYNLDFALHVMTKNFDDVLQIVEQILPYFTPEFTVTININSINKKIDVPIILTSVDREEDYEGDFETRRSIVWTLNFNVKHYIYGKVKDSSIIKNAIVTFFDLGILSPMSMIEIGQTGPSGETGGAFSRVLGFVTGPSGASSDWDNFIADSEVRIYGMTGDDGIDIYGDPLT